PEPLRRDHRSHERSTPMDSDPLVSPHVEAGEWFVGEFDKYKPVKAAYWLRREGDGDWYLHVASDAIDDADIPAAYGEVLRIAGEARNPGIDPFRVKVVRAGDPVARAIVDFTN